MECNDLDYNLNKISRSIEERSPKSVFIKKKYIIQQKILNQLIDIYQIKAKYQTPKANTTRKAMRFKSTMPMPLPSIHQIYPLSPPVSMSRRREKERQNLSLQLPIEKKEVHKDKLINLRELLTKKAKQKAKEQKENMMILKDNLCLYKDNLRLENKNKKNIVMIKKKIMNESILNYQQCKKDYIDFLNNYDINQLNEENENKKNELVFWKKQTFEKMKKSNSMSSLLFMTQNINNINDHNN